MRTKSPRWAASILGTLLLLGLVASGARAQQTIYDDSLAAGWGNYSWAANDLNNASPVHGGAHSIKVTVAAGSYGALELRAASPLDATKFGALTFWIHGGPTGGQSHLVVKASVGGKQQGGVSFPTPEANKWTQVTVPLAGLGVATETNLTGFLIQNNSPDAAPTFYVDDVGLTAAKPGAAPIKAALRPHVAHPLAFTGVNLSGGEFGPGPKPGFRPVFGHDFTYPTAGEMDYFVSKGVNVVRIPFRWGILQPEANGPLDPTETDRYAQVVTQATGKGLTVLLDPHDYARYDDKVIGGPDVPDAVFADFWGKLAARFKDNPKVWFGLMNEPHDMPAAQWLGAANAAVAAIRQAGAKNFILVPGVDWTGAHSWVSGGSGAAMLGLKDPQNHYVFEVHQYLDSDSSGTKPSVVSATIGPERLKEFTLWCRKNHQRGFLGEFGAADSPEADAAVTNTLAYMEQNPDVWVGYTWWSAGPWWGDYMFTVEPKDGHDRPQMAYLEPHLQVKPKGKRSP